MGTPPRQQTQTHERRSNSEADSTASVVIAGEVR